MFRTGFAVGRSSILSASLGCLHTFHYQSTNMLNCLRPKLSLTVFSVGAINYSICNFIQFGNYRIYFHACALLSSPDTVADKCAVGSNEHSLCIFRPIAYFRLTIRKYTHLPSPDTVYDRVCRLLIYSLCNFIQVGNFRISFHAYAHLSTLPYGTRGV